MSFRCYDHGLPILTAGGVYHTYDYPFYFYSIRANAQNRVEHYLAENPQK